VTLSPDGTSVYVASETSRSVSIFARDATTGAITQLAGTEGCVSDSGTAGACADGTALVGPRAVAVSPDGKNFYFPSSFDAAIAVFARDATTGALRQLAGTAGCVSETGTAGACADGTALDGARGVAVSPDGKSVYVAAFFADAVATFSRDESTGALSQLGGPDGCVSETGSGGACADGTALDGVRSVAVSADGKNVYAASETSGAVSVFARNATTGALTQLGGTVGCVSQTGTGGACIDGRALTGAGDVTVTPDGSYAYVASLGSDAVVAFSRNGTTGALTQLAGTGGCVSETGNSGSCVDGTALDRSRSIVVSLDGKSVYVASENSDAVAVFSRDATTGVLTQLAGTGGCLSETGTGGACADGTALDGARSVAVSPDGKSVYAASFYSSAVSIFSRNPTTGALTQLGGSPPPPPPPPPGSVLSFSLRDSATVGGVVVANEDIVAFYGTTGFQTSFDGSDVGLSTLRIDAFAWLDADSLLLSFDAPASIPGIAGTVDDSDIVRFDATSLGTATAGTFGVYFDGSDVGLTTNAHDVDAVELLTDGRLLMSTTGSATVSGATARDEDLLAFAPTSLGDVTAGRFALWFDGSDVGLGDAGEDVDAAAVDATSRLYLSTPDVFAVPGVSGGDEDVFVFTPTTLDPPTTAGTYASTLFFDGSSYGLGANDVFAIDVP
jgi:6-phosphogluconolactonase (cycloisomerase 2 family)